MLSVHPLLIAPFVLMLLSIAVLPLMLGHWWEKNANKALVAGILGLPIAVYFIVQGEAGWASVEHALIEYVEFIILLGALYIISGGIVLQGDLRATPLVNTAFLGFGALIASVMGTTGASMLLIRPVLQTNSERRHVVHTIVFFIFLVSNLGGCLTPLGDPPLFLGYLRGVPFAWTLSLWPIWLVMNSVLLVIYFVWDTVMYKREAARDITADQTRVEPLRLRGSSNFFFLGLVVLAVALLPPPWRSLLMVAAVLGSLYSGDPSLRTLNKFTYYPIIEVAVLFIGIFLTMIPALQLLRLYGHHLGVDTPAEFFWATGVLSSFLDNAPTYATFFEAARAQVPTTFTGPTVVGMPASWLEAISLGAVFMGANTYIGNGPNFMVKAVAEEAGVPMPSFFGYMRYSCLVLLPLFGLLTWCAF
ncbi:MAG: sodium:proton antiporter [Candidatus Tectomicrobia bacterium]|uniref:Sodium:proton antiporter n=1 Tax=Tectimicrobiota bacterium TaxID=2528274 RepID=A0A937W6X0_UNCTE|nr:sodium:proton antiporter [Candidatus Tectomicrobia bacterium]